jgi:quercetin dioxygenase-like cupin family protein
MDYPEISLGVVHNVWARQMHFLKAGDHETQHTHQFDHLTLLAKGSLEVTTNGEVTVFTAPHMIFISKDSIHSMTALEDNTVAYCIHSLNGSDSTRYVDDLVSADMVPNGINKDI